MRDKSHYFQVMARFILFREYAWRCILDLLLIWEPKASIFLGNSFCFLFLFDMFDELYLFSSID